MDMDTDKDNVISDDLTAEIDAAIEESVSTSEEESGADNEGGATDEMENNNLPSGEVQPDDEDEKGDRESPDDDGKKGDENSGEDDEPPVNAITDDHLERAVRVGMTIADARSFKSADALERMCSMLETKQDDGGDGGDDASDDEDDDPLDGIPDLDPDEYDEAIVNGFKAMKDIIRGQQDTIKGLKSGGRESWFDTAVSKLAVTPDETQKAALKKKVDILTAGYEAAGDRVDQADVFKEASEIVLGKELAEAADKSKIQKLNKRKTQHSSRPGGRGVKPKADTFEDIASEIDQKYFKD